MNDKRAMLVHFLAALAYRTQKALRGASPSFAAFEAGNQVRNPQWLVRHMDGVLGYALAALLGLNPATSFDTRAGRPIALTDRGRPIRAVMS